MNSNAEGVYFYVFIEIWKNLYYTYKTRHKLNKNACYVFAYICRMLKVCVAAIGALRFGCAASAAHFWFLEGFYEKTRVKNFVIDYGNNNGGWNNTTC